MPKLTSGPKGNRSGRGLQNKEAPTAGAGFNLTAGCLEAGPQVEHGTVVTAQPTDRAAAAVTYGH